MDVPELLRLFADRERLRQMPLEELQQWAQRYPASFLMQTLLAARMQGTAAYQSQLATASLLASDRGKLKEFLEIPMPATAAQHLLLPTSLPDSGITPDLQLPADPEPADVIISAGEQQAIMLIEEEFAEEASYERQEELLLVSELAGGGAEFVPLPVDESPQDYPTESYADDVEASTALLLEQQRRQAIRPEDDNRFVIRDVNQPGQFLPDKIMPFGQWLKLFSAPPQPQSPPAEAPAPEPPNRFLQQHEEELQRIDQFMAACRQPVRRQQVPSVESLSRQSTELHDDVVSETLASVYESQGLWEQAIRQYVKLSLKFPEKVAFFAARIRELKQKKK